MRIVPVLMNASRCWLWQGATRDGYAYARANGIVVGLHRFVYEQTVGPIPDGHDLHHRCEARNCLNPKHLQVLTHAAHAATHNPTRDTCRRGHDLTDPAVGVYKKDGRRFCRTCDNEVNLARYHRSRATVSRLA